jgi:hypothetical protein
MEQPWAISLAAGWIGMFGGAISGAVLGLFFHDDQWLGGYGSFRRRLLRLGHIAFFGLGFVNVLCGLTLRALPIAADYAAAASGGLLLAAVAMPLCCFLAAWHKPLRHLFPIPVLGLFVGLAGLLTGWWAA